MAPKTPSSSNHLFFFFFQLLILFFCKSVTSSDIPLPRAKDFKVVWEKEQLFPSIHRALAEYFQTELDSIDPPTTALPSAPPLTNPVTTPAVNTAPGIITVPGTNPTTNPVSPTVPVNPVTSPSPNVPVNPVTTPSTNPPAASGGTGRGQSWCVAKNGASQAALQSALDYACGIGGADCAALQQGSSCYEPATLQNHASYAFNSYYQKNPVPTSCDFAGAAAVTTTNPSTGSCVYPSSSLSSSPSISTPTPSTSTPTPPITQTPVNPTSLPPPTASLPTAPTTSLPSAGSTFPGTQPPPPGFSFGNPDPTGLGAFGASPPLVDNMASVVSKTRVWSVVVVASIIMSGLFDC